MRLEAMRKDEHRLEIRVINALARLGDLDAVLAAEALLQDPDEDVRARQLAVVVGLRKRQGADPLDVVLRALRSSRAQVREAAIEVALDLRDEHLLPAVAALLQDRADGVRHLARQFIKDLRCQTRELLEPVLAFLLDPAREVDERIGAIQALMYTHRVPYVAEVLRRAVEDPDVAIRLWAGRALPYFEDRPATARALLSRLEDPVLREVEISLLWALARLGVAESRELLIQAVQSGDPLVVEPAAYGLGLAGDPQDLEVLRKVLAGLRESQGMAAAASSWRQRWSAEGAEAG